MMVDQYEQQTDRAMRRAKEGLDQTFEEYRARVRRSIAESDAELRLIEERSKREFRQTLMISTVGLIVTALLWLL